MKVVIDGTTYVPEARGFALSILVPSVASRRATFAPKIMDQLFGQRERLSEEDQARVEILVLVDSKSKVLGDKRNDLVRLAQGEYTVFVDDDDRVTEDYVSSLLEATQSGADVITFDASVSLNGAPAKPCRYSLKFDEDKNTNSEYIRIPNHLSAVKRDLALRAPFASRGRGEDSEYARSLKPLLRTEHRIARTLYYYDFSSSTTETQQPGGAEPDRCADVDVVILSKAVTPELQKMTENAIRTCRAGAGDHSINIVVIEQAAGVSYKDAVTHYTPEKFAYNKFANAGIRTGSAPWVMVANSDLEFSPGWLQPLLSAGHDLVSPVCPNAQRQKRLRRVEAGTENGVHLSGWCFLMKRTLWESIGGLDEDFIFWCADDSLIEQVKKVGIFPAVVPSSRVTHLVSKTASGTVNPSGELTWAMVRLFNKKYGANKFNNDARYRAWQVANPEV